MIKLYDYFKDHLVSLKESISDAGTDKNGKKWEDYDTIKVPLADGTYEIVDMKKLLQEQERAKAALSHLQPFFAGLVSSIRYVYTFHVETQATDGTNIFVNPLFTSRLSFEAKVFVLAHEIMHNVLNHMRREKEAGMSDHDHANIAADYEVNITLESWDLCNMDTLKSIGAYVNKKYLGWGFEKIYEDPDCKEAADKRKKKGQQQQQGDGDGQGQQQGGGGGESQKHSADYKKGWAQAIKDYKAGKIKI